MTFVLAPCGNQLRLTGSACLNKVFYLSKNRRRKNYKLGCNAASIMDQFIGTMMHQTNSLWCRFAGGSFAPHTLPLPPTTQCCVLWNDVRFRPTQFRCQHWSVDEGEGWNWGRGRHVDKAAMCLAVLYHSIECHQGEDFKLFHILNNQFWNF
jgi:hypothetical protein